MAESVIHTFEVIEIKAQDRDAFAALHARELTLHRLAQAQPVRQVRERVMMRHMLEPLFKFLSRAEMGDKHVERSSERRNFFGPLHG